MFPSNVAALASYSSIFISSGEVDPSVYWKQREYSPPARFLVFIPRPSSALSLGLS